MSDIPSLYNYSRSELCEELQQRYQAKAYRSMQVFEWLYRHGAQDIDAMSNLSKELRQSLKADFSIMLPEQVQRQESVDGTVKYLFRVIEGVEIESVLIEQKGRKTLCVSSQYGCGMACTFCQTGTMGFRKNLSTASIVGQVLAVGKDAERMGARIDNIVFMGMGEPLHNFQSVTRAIGILLDAKGFAFGPRKITLSTVGLVPAIKKFGALGTGVNLAVSLNATSNEVRDVIMPVNRRYPIEDLIACLKEFPLEGRKKITIEYVMLRGVNDTRADRERLLKLLSDMRVKLNLIPYNENANLGFKAPEADTVFAWSEYLNSRDVSTTIRWSKGLDIDAACGQLATDEQAKERGSGDDVLRVLSNHEAALQRIGTTVRQIASSAS